MFFGWTAKALRSMNKTRVVVGLGAAGAGLSAATFVGHQMRQKIKGTDAFSEHTRQQHQKHIFSGMHELFITKDPEALGYFRQHFNEFSDLMPQSVEQFKAQQAVKTAVKIRPLSECPVSLQSAPATFLAVGGPSALMAAIASLEAGKQVVVINDANKRPIGKGMAYRMEWDSPAEKPSSSLPSSFMWDQIRRALYDRESYEEIERTGMYPWKSLDWFGFAEHPEQWPAAFRVALAFQMKNMGSAKIRDTEAKSVAEECFLGQLFFEKLNKGMGGKLLLPVRGSHILARDKEELQGLYDMQKALAEEGRSFDILTPEQMKEKGLPLKGLACGVKHHDAVLSPHYNELMQEHIAKLGGNLINGTLTTVYTDGKNPGGIALYKTPDGKEHYQRFEDMAMSLGNQPVYGMNDKPLFDLIGATGLSGLVMVFSPPELNLPSAVLGGTNYMTKISPDPISVVRNGEVRHLNLFRVTSTACVTPIERGDDSVTYDGTAGRGLMSSIRLSYDESCEIMPLTLGPCTRAVSKNGQTDIMQPAPRLLVQYGAGGGGGTRAAKIAVSGVFKHEEAPKPKPNIRSGMGMMEGNKLTGEEGRSRRLK